MREFTQPADDPLPKIPGGWRDEPFVIGDRTLHMAVAIDPELLLELPETLAEHEVNEYIPYWAWLWPAAFDMAKWLAARKWPPQCEALELGCGMGLVGIAAAASGLQMTISDYREEAVAVVRSNLARNGLQADVQQIDWRDPSPRRWSVMFLCDVLYEAINHSAIIEYVGGALTADGECWIGDPGRGNATEFLRAVKDDARLMAATDDGLPLDDVEIGRFTMIRLTRI